MAWLWTSAETCEECGVIVCYWEVQDGTIRVKLLPEDWNKNGETVPRRLTQKVILSNKLEQKGWSCQKNETKKMKLLPGEWNKKGEIVIRRMEKKLNCWQRSESLGNDLSDIEKEKIFKK